MLFDQCSMLPLLAKGPGAYPYWYVIWSLGLSPPFLKGKVVTFAVIVSP